MTSWKCYSLDLSFIQDRRATYCIWHIICNSLPKHGCCQSTVHVFCIQVFVFTIEEQRSCVAPQKVSEGLAHHGKAEHRSILKRKRPKLVLQRHSLHHRITLCWKVPDLHKLWSKCHIWPYPTSCLHHESSINDDFFFSLLILKIFSTMQNIRDLMYPLIKCHC